MPTRVFLTVDTELMWRHHAAGLPIGEIAERSLEPAGVGIGYQLRRFAEHGLKATFFVDLDAGGGARPRSDPPRGRGDP